MNAIVTRYAEAAFVLLVTGCALAWPPLALIAGAAYLIALAAIADRRAPVEEPK